MVLTPCLNPATLPWGTSIDRFAAAASAAGYPAVEVSVQQLQQLILDRSEAAVRDLLDELGLTVEQGSGILPAGPVLPAPLLIGDDEYAEALRTLPERLAAFQAVSCSRAAIVVNPYTVLSDGEARKVATGRLAQLAEAAADHGVRLCVEFIGTGLPGLDESLSGDSPFVRRLADLTGLLADVPAGNVSVLLDVFHWMAAGGDVSEVTKLGTGAIGSVQISDVGATIARDALTDADRLIPGEGIVDWPALGAALDAASYSGPVSVELFNPDLWQRPIPEICRRTLQGAVQCLAKMGNGGENTERQA